MKSHGTMTKSSRGVATAGVVLSLLLASDATVTAGGPGWVPGQRHLAAQDTEREVEATFLQARSLINQGEFRRAAEGFRSLRAMYEGPGYRGSYYRDSFYWEAYSRHRLGELREAVALLDSMLADIQRTITPGSTHVVGHDEGWVARSVDEIRQLRLRILGELAEQGDPRAAQEVLRESDAALGLMTEALDSIGPLMAAAFDSVGPLMAEALDSIGPLMAAAFDSIGPLMVEAFDSMGPVMAAAFDSMATALDSAGAAVGEAAEMAAEAVVHELEERAEAMARTADSVMERFGLEEQAMIRDMTDRLDAMDGVAGWVTFPRELPEGCEDASVQQEALTALMRLETDRVRILRSVLERTDPCSVNLREQAVERLAREGTTEAEEAVISAALEHPDPETRRSAVRGLRRFDTERSLTALRSVLVQSTGPRIQEAAISALRRSDNPDARFALAAYVRDSSMPEDLRASAIEALGRRDDVPSEELVALYASLHGASLKSAVVRRLRGRSHEDRVANWLFERAVDTNESEDLRAQALEAWARSPSVELSSLGEFYPRLEESELKERIFYALYRKASSHEENAPQIVREMIELARVETDPEVRERAVYWLGRTGTPEAVEFLLELLAGAAADTLTTRNRMHE